MDCARVDARPVARATRATWEQLLGAGVRFHTSIPVVLETFTFLDRNASRDVALAWKDSLTTVRSREDVR